MKKVFALLFVSFLILQLFAVTGVSAANLPFTALGQVVDRHGNPVKGASVTLWDGSYHEIGTVTTDDNGNFGFTNVIAGDNSGCKVTIDFKDGNKEYKTGYQDMIWYSIDGGIVKFDTKYTTLTNYPAPEYGYLWGVMQADGANQRALGNGVVYAMSGDQKYYIFTDNVRNKGTFMMRLPVGHYKVWGQYMENGMLFQSSKMMDVDVVGSTNYLDTNSVTVSVPLSAAAQNPVPSSMPTGDEQNVVSGYVTFKDGKGIPDQVVKLYQSTDDGMSYLTKGETRTDINGYYEFRGIQVTADAPDNQPVYGSKGYNLTMVYTDPNGQKYAQNSKFTLYNPDFVTADTIADHRARNPVLNFTIPYSTLGWVKISSDTQGVKLYIDNKLITDSSNQPVVMPYTANLAPGRHVLRMTSTGYEDRTIPVDIKENQQTEDVFVHLDKSAIPVVPQFVQLAVVVLILVAALLVLLVLVFMKRQLFLGLLGGALGPLKGAFGNFRASSQARKAHRAQTAEARKAEQARQAKVRESALASQAKIDGKGRGKDKAFNARAEQPRLPEYHGEEEEDEKPSMVMAHEIYRKQDKPAVERMSASSSATSMERMSSQERMPPSNVERMSASQQARSPVSHESRPMPSDSDGRIRVPKSMPAPRDQPQATSIKDKERVIRYIREHQDGVSFIQMSNDLEIAPNTLTVITKELVINDDIEKIKGMYYYKSHDSSSDESKSSVVVWRLDGEE